MDVLVGNLATDVSPEEVLTESCDFDLYKYCTL